MTLKDDWGTGDTYNADDMNALTTQVNENTAVLDNLAGLQVNVLSYGAVGDGTTDDTAAIHAARDAAGVGGTVFFPPGTYKIVGNNDGTGCLLANVADQTWHISPEATLVQYNHSRALITVDANRVTLTGGGTLNGGRDTLGDNAFTVLAIVRGTPNSTDLTIDGLRFTKSSHWGVWGIASRTRVTRCTFTEIWTVPIFLMCHTLALTSFGYPIVDTYDFEASYNFIDRSDVDPAVLTAEAAVGIQIRGNGGSATPGNNKTWTYRPKILYNTVLQPENPDEPTGRIQGAEIGYARYGLAQGNRMVNGSMGVSFATHDYGQSIGNTFIGSALFGQELAFSQNCIVQGNIIDGNGGVGGNKASGSGINANSMSDNALIVGNHIYDLAATARPIASASASGLLVTGNNIQGNYGINLTTQTDSVVSGNSFVGANSGTAVSLVDCTGATVTGNVMQDYTAGVYIGATSGTSDYITVTGNHFHTCTTPVDGVASGGTIGANIVNASNTVRA